MKNTESIKKIILMVLGVLMCIAFAFAAIDPLLPWHPLQQIATDSSGTASVGDTVSVKQGLVGIGTANPKTTLTVNGPIENSGDPRYYRNLASYTGPSTVTGTAKITLPKYGSNTMMQVRIQGYDYSRGAWEVIIGGYNYYTHDWYNYNAEVRGNPPFTKVRLANDGSKDIILLGETTTQWTYPKITVSEFIAGYSRIDDWGTGWSIGMITSEAGIQSVFTPSVMRVGSGNIGLGDGDSYLNLYSSTNTEGGIRMNHKDGTLAGYFYWDDDDIGILGPERGSWSYKISADGSHRWYDPRDSSLERMAIDPLGNVGIGTATPAAKLHVVGNLQVGGSITATGPIYAVYG